MTLLEFINKHITMRNKDYECKDRKNHSDIKRNIKTIKDHKNKDT